MSLRTRTTDADAPLDGGPEVPLAIGGFPVVRLLGEGGMGQVFACKDEKLDRIVAVKVLRPDLASQPALVERFLREARAMARIASPHVVTVHQVGEDGKTPFLVMELLDGEDLAARVSRRGAIAPYDAVRYVRDAVQGLAAASEAGIIHRDVKPANLFVVDGRVKLTDFGLARPMDGDPRLTQEGLVVGTPHYLAPEAARGQLHDEASDIYALGSTLFELLTGHPPYPGQAALDVISAHLTKPVPSVRKERPEVPGEVERLVKRMMAKQVKDRFRDYASLAAAVDEVLARLEPSPFSLDAPKTPPPEPGRLDPRVSSPQIKTATLTVMLTDIAGYTERTAHQSREEAARWLSLHDALLTPVLKAFGGRVVKTLGDAFLVTFSSPTDAVLCGTAIQDRLFLHNQRAAEPDRIHVRVALSAGEVRLHKSDVLGEPVNLVSRLEELAQPGEVVLSDAVFSTMNVAEVPVEAIGEQSFKGILRPVKLYRAARSAEPDKLPFGGRALARASLDDLPGMPRRALGTSASSVMEPVLRRLTVFGRRAARRVPGGARGLAAACLALALAVGGAGLYASLDTRELSPEEALVLQKKLSAVPRKERSGRHELRLGHAYRVLEQEREALKAYRRALEKGRHDDAALGYALSSLGEDESEDAVELLAAWPDDIEDELAGLLDAGWWPRHNALRALEKRNEATDAQRQEVGLKDLVEGETCGQRRFGLMLLKRVGIGPKVLEAVQDAGKRMPDNVCMALDLASVEEAVAARK